jgi:hypothetical protein
VHLRYYIFSIFVLDFLYFEQCEYRGNSDPKVGISQVAAGTFAKRFFVMVNFADLKKQG